jgi:heme-degrading monooxygenase HmoA
MFHHIVLMRFTADADAQFLSRAEHFCEQIRRSTPGLEHYVLRRNAASRADGLDWAIVSSFRSAADHDAYQVSDLHQQMKHYMTPFIERIVACDVNEEEPA